jgi:phosphoadenosine phosphosulfate reductase
MEYIIHKKANEEMALLAQKHEACLVAFSGGKDSLVCLDLACRHFKKVLPFNLYFVPGLKCIEDNLDIARKKYRLNILYYPSFLLFNVIRRQIYCKSSIKTFESIKPLSLIDIYKAIMYDTGIEIIINGAKKSDSMWRRQKYFTYMKHSFISYPLVDWRKIDVMAYLKIHNLPIPVSSGHGSTGVDLSEPSIRWLHDQHHDDYLILRKWFPLVEAVIKRRNWYGAKE